MIDDKKIFIIGAKGQLGLALKKQYPNAQWADKDELDITNIQSITSTDWSSVEIILNAAAYTNVDGAESADGRQIAWNVNAQAVAFLSEIAIQHDCTLVHISTDYVFDGTKQIHDENESFTPLSVYGASKAAGDIAVSLTPKHYILRTSWVIGDGKNFVRTMVSLAEKNISPTVVHDQVGRLTFTSELVRGIDFLLQNKVPYGTYNLSNSGDSVSWADITREIFTHIGRSDLKVTNCTTEEYYKDKEGIAPRPLLSTLSLDKLESMGFTCKDWREDLTSYLDQSSI